MKRSLLRLLLPLVFAGMLTGCEQLPDSMQSLNFGQSITSSGFAASASEEAVSEKMTPAEEIKTDGLTAWLVEDHSLPLVSLQLMFDGAGSSSDPKGKEGRAMFAAALLDEGAGNLNALAFQQALEDKAIQLSFSTDEDVLIVQLRCLSENLPDAFRLIELALTKPTFSSKDITRKRALALSTLNNAKSRPGFVLASHFNEMAFTDHPYGASPLGTEKSLGAITRDDLKNYTYQVLTKDRLFISASGDIKADVLKTLMEEHLQALPETSMLPAPPDIALAHQGVVSVIEMDVPQSSVLVATPSVSRSDDRFFAAYVLNHIIGGDTLTSVLGTAIREKKGLAYSVNSYLDPMDHSNNFKVRFATRNEEVGEAYDTLKEELTTISKNGVSEKQLADALEYITGSFVLSLDNNVNYTRYLGTMQRYDLGMDYLQTRNAKMRSVTLEQVNELATEMFDPDKWLVVVVGKPDKLESGPTANTAK